MPPIFRSKQIEVESFGLYEGWSHKGKELPKILDFTERIPISTENEFGMIVLVKKARGRFIDWEIIHPEWADDDGNIVAPFRGRTKVENNAFRFFIGDTFWEPLENKAGTWTIRIMVDGQEMIRKDFSTYLPEKT